MNIGVNIGHVITAIRKEKGLSQSQLAKQIGVTQTTMSMIETEKWQPTKETFAKIADRLGVWGPEIVLRGIDWQNMPEDAKLRIDGYLEKVITK